MSEVNKVENGKAKMFELYDDVVGNTLSYHQSLSGALTAMAEAITKLNPALCRDYENDPSVDFKLTYRIVSHELKP